MNIQVVSSYQSSDVQTKEFPFPDNVTKKILGLAIGSSDIQTFMSLSLTSTEVRRTVLLKRVQEPLFAGLIDGKWGWKRHPIKNFDMWKEKYEEIKYISKKNKCSYWKILVLLRNGNKHFSEELKITNSLLVRDIPFEFANSNSFISVLANDLFLDQFNERKKSRPKIMVTTNSDEFTLSSLPICFIPGDIPPYKNYITTLSIDHCPLKSLPNAWIGCLENLEILKVVECGLISIPKEIGALKHLGEVILRKNEIRRIPPELYLATNLKTLDVYSNNIHSLPNGIEKLNLLRILNLFDNPIVNFPNEIFALENLSIFHFGKRNLFLKGFGSSLCNGSIKFDIGALKDLKELTIIRTNLETLSTDIGQLKILKYLDISQNQLAFVPREIANLKLLSHLDLSFNKIQHLPKVIGELRSLKYLNISRNALQELPKEVGNLSLLTFLSIKFNKISSLPRQVRKIYCNLDKKSKEELKPLYDQIILTRMENAANTLEDCVGDLIEDCIKAPFKRTEGDPRFQFDL